MDSTQELAEIKSLIPEILAAAQAQYDAWDQDDEGVDAEFGAGGICDAIANEIGSVLSGHGFDIVDGGQDGDDHAFIFAQKNGNVFSVDIPPGLYESGCGYSWRKREGVVFDAGMLEICEASYIDVYGEEYHPESPSAGQASEGAECSQIQQPAI